MMAKKRSKSFNIVLMLIVIILVIGICVLLYNIIPRCGNNKCDGNENKCTCSQDCGSCSGKVGSCGENMCEKNECIVKIKNNCCGNDKCEYAESYEEDYNSCPNDCPEPMLFEGIGHIGHGRLLKENVIEFRRSDLNHDGGFYAANVNVPIQFQTKVRGIDMNLRCVNEDTRSLLFNSMEDKNEKYKFYSPEHLDYSVGGYAEIQASENIVLNTGFRTGTKIIEAGKDDEAEFLIQFDFAGVNFPINMECNLGIISEKPAQSIHIPMEVRYRE
mgnify:CR=1 FL=1|tara:strand:- start:214 stop:1032 length:819 start_codon:yes stop_codon:yes gene_type:complete